MKYIGAHVSTSGGVENAPGNARAIGANAFALFTKNQRQWAASPLTPESIAAFRGNCAKYGYTPEHILPHDSYLINLGNPDAEKRRTSLESFLLEARRCAELGLTLLNFHPGSHLKEISTDECLKLIAEGLNVAAREVPGVKFVLENTAGQGTNVGFAFEQLGRIIEYSEVPERLGVCVDTCHAFAAGYDLTTDEGYAWMWAEFDRKIGRGYLSAMHLNDAKGGLGSRLDRHESLGAGQLGWESFGRLMRDPRTNDIPLILETVNPDLWAEEIRHLYRLAED